MKPASISDFAIWTCHQKRWLKPTWSRTFALLQASTIRRAGLDVERQRLLAEHVLAVGGRRHHGLLVEAVGRGHDDGVDVGRREDGLEAFEGPAPEIGRERLGAVAVAVEHRGEGGPLGRLHRRSVAEPHDRAGADQPDPDRRCLLGRHGGFNRRRGRTGCARTRVDRKNLSSLPPGSRPGPAPRTASPGRDANGPKASCAAPPRKADLTAPLRGEGFLHRPI